MGFNPAVNSMPGTDAIIFWMNSTGSNAVVGTYHLSVAAATGVNPDNTRLSFVNGSAPTVVADANNLYLTYKVKQNIPSNFAYQNFVMGVPGDIPSGSVITAIQQQHQGESSVRIDFETGMPLLPFDLCWLARGSIWASWRERM